MTRYTFIIFLAFIAVNSFSQQQDQGSQVIKLDDMSSFRTQAGNWRIAGDVMISPITDIHAAEISPPPEPAKKRRNKKAAPEAEPRPTAVSFSEGKGILLNYPDKEKKDNLLTAFEHGDIDLELELMMPKGSNSGIYLQGRYEVQLLDSWGVKNPKFSDIGGIYRNWETQPGKIYMGKAPLKNPAKAPGLWQKMRISFRAPKFDPRGNKISNARFTSVELNGVKIHDNIEVPLPTGGPIENNEKPFGPLMIQGDHGPVAFRNIRYRLMKESGISLNDISYKTYYGKFTSEKDYVSLAPSASGKMEELSCEILAKENEYGSTYSGKIAIPEDAEYEFVIRFTGGGSLKINDQELYSFQRADGWIDESKKIFLRAGTYSFEIQNFKDVGWMPPRLGLWVQSGNTYPKALHAFNSFPPDENPASQILLNPGSEPKLLRAFFDFKGDRKQRLTHTIGVGDPSGIHYVYDLRSANLICVWRGDFADATPMWHDRGDGSFLPGGAVLYLFNHPPLASHGSGNEISPAKPADDYKNKGYIIEENTSRPVFRYLYKGMEVEDKIYPEDEGRILTHEISMKNIAGLNDLYYKIAEGTTVVKIPEGLYAIDGRQYYIRTDPSLQPLIRDAGSKKELVVPVRTNSVKYSIIW